MRLAKVTLAGFKSFADKTDLTFESPVTGIVGPNGCGKSNVVDAIKWVLGELSAKSLRGGAMLDMIFNGSATRKPSGMASVTLTFENPLVEVAPGPSPAASPADPAAAADGSQPAPARQPALRRILAIDADTVAVTRQLFRDGTSEYLINKQRARLRDIRELFMDTGVGTEAYSIIEQGKVDLMLQANPDERREIFEEAAGISKFKARKKETQRKLERIEQNLNLSRQRLEDIQRRLRSVKIQAGRARSYQEYSVRLRELRLKYALAEFHKLRTELAQVVDQLEQAEADRAVVARKLAQAEEALADAQTERQGVADQLKEIEHERLQMQAQKEQAQQRRQFAQTTLADLRRQIERDTQRLAELATRSGEIAQELKQQSQAAQALVATQADVSQRLDQALARDRELAHQLNEKRAALEDEKAGVVDRMRRTTQLHNQIQSLGVFEQNLHSTQQKLESRSAEVAEELTRLYGVKDEAAGKLSECRTLIDAQNIRTTLARNELDSFEPSPLSLMPERFSSLTISRSRSPIMRLNSPAFSNGAAIPQAYTCDGQDISPPLDWRETDDVLTASLTLPRRIGTPAQQRDFAARWLEAMRALPGVKAETQVIALDLAGIAVSAGAACSSGKIAQSHVLAAMGLGDLAGQAIRVSLPWNATAADIAAFTSAYRALAARLLRRAA